MLFIKSSFTYNGMVDDYTYTTPEMMKLLNMCKTKKHMLSANYGGKWLQKLYEEQICVGMLTDKNVSTY